ncbi:MAG: hypothetical protein NDI69_17605 [Bacteriovoracaceae bacterium]|nr:hypothetical protein [Bacteriovoracaceae bacterium]
MWIILGVLFSFSVLALEPFERLNNVKILRVLPNNIVMLNRGIEDGILRNDHAKLSSDTAGYGARAICLKVSSDVSYWRLYRVPNSEAFSQDYLYTITGLADREIPVAQAELRNQRHAIEEEKKKVDPGPDPFAIKTDLPEKLTERDLIKSEGPERRKLFIEQTLNKDLLQRDLEDYRISLYASPFTRQSINEGESLRYGFRGGNIASKYRLLTQFEQQQTKLKDPVTKESVSTRSTTGQVQFVISGLTTSLSSLSLVNYNSQRFSELATPQHHWQVGPIGFTWHLYESKTWEYMDLSYIPLYDVRTTEVMNDDGSLTETETNGLRHGFRLAFKTRINERVAFENLLWVRPFQDLASWEIEGDNLNLSNDLKLIFNLSENLFFDYNFVYQKDKLWKTLSDLPESNTINSINVRYDFDF